MRIIVSNFRYYLLPGLDFEISTLRALTLRPPLLTNDHSHEVQFARRESRVSIGGRGEIAMFTGGV